MDIIDLRKIKTVRDFISLEEQLLITLKPKIFNIRTRQDLEYHILSCLSPINANIENTQESINRGLCCVYELITEEESCIKSARKYFETWINPFKSLPREELLMLQYEALKDWRRIKTLIARDEGSDIIKNHNIKPKEKTRSVEHRVKIDFYKRCKDSKVDIRNYLKNGIKDRSIYRSTFDNKNRHKLQFIYSYADFPYRKNFENILFVNYDCENIDKSIHRLQYFTTNELKTYSEMFRTDKDAFYKEVFKRNSISDYFNNIELNIDLIPKCQHRKEIVRELKTLADNDLWIAFYALSLIQVEGIFSEIVNNIYPPQKMVISDKVLNTRHYSALSPYYFDYFEYVFPEIRNSFAHTGKLAEGDYQLGSYDLLLDLDYLFDVFANSIPR